MRLADFLLHDLEGIVADWDAFAATLLPAATSRGPLQLRDHAREIRQAIAQNLRTPQPCLQQDEKPEVHTPVATGAPETATQTHGVLRA